jgi:hypothetical protein
LNITVNINRLFHLPSQTEKLPDTFSLMKMKNFVDGGILKPEREDFNTGQHTYRKSV